MFSLRPGFYPQYLALICVGLYFHFLAREVIAEGPSRARPKLAPDWMLPAKRTEPPPQTEREESRPALEQPEAPVETPDLGPAIPAGTLAWDTLEKQRNVSLGTARTSFSFGVTNASPDPVVVTALRPSCGCTIPKLPEKMPWTLAPGSTHEIEVEMDLAGKRGTVAKAVVLLTDHGHQSLKVRVDIAEPPAAAGNDRERNLQLAMANRQSVLQGSCAACHATPALGKMGAELFQNACAICHESDQRASSVPDLRQLAKPTDATHWRAWITTSAEGKLMPAFGLEHGGILTREQIDSLVAYLTKTLSASPPSSKSPAAVLNSATR
jgi:mono/diheme cytochrome c family protein